MPEIILKDKSGTEQTYDYKKVSFRTPTEGEKAEFIFPNFAELEITENGEYSVPEGVDGYTKVKANVPVPTLISGAEFELDFSGGDIHIAAPDGYAFTGGTIKKPETLIPENIAKDVVVAGITGTHEGGGAVEGTATVTFRNYDGTELFSRLVFAGDNCPDPVEQGKIDEPTRESTAQYTYAYNGWSLTAGGTASASALNVVTGDRTVYAAYTQNVRYYTARFYDGATLMQEPQLVAYGSKATPPDTTKTGYEFVAWTPNDLTIYGDTDFYGTWEEFRGYIYNETLSNHFSKNDYIMTMAFSETGNRLICTTDKRVILFDTSTSPYTKLKDLTLSPYTGYPKVAINKDGTRCAYSAANDSSSSQTYVMDISGSQWKQFAYTGALGRVEDMAFDETGAYLLITSKKGHIMYDLEQNATTTKKTLTRAMGSCCANGFWFAGNGSSKGLTCYKYTGGDWNEITVDVPSDSVVFIAISNNGRRVAVCTNVSTTNNIYTLSYDEENDTFINDGYITSVEISKVDTMSYANDNMTFNPSASVLAVPRKVVGSNSYLTLLDMTTTPISKYYDVDIPLTKGCNATAYSPDGKHLLCSYYGMAVYDTRL